MDDRINRFKDLRVYPEARVLDFARFTPSKPFPKEELYSLTDPVCRSSRSIGAHISEPWAKRRYPAHFVSKLTDAEGEWQETRYGMGRGFACGYPAASAFDRLEKRCDKIGNMLGKMI